MELVKQYKHEEEARAAFLAIEAQNLEGLRKQVEILRQYRENGWSIEWFPKARRALFMLMVAGQLKLEAYERFAHTKVLGYVRKLDPARQMYFAEGGACEIVCRVDGRTETRKCDPLKISSFELQQYFGKDGERDAAEQVSWLDTYTKKHAQISIEPEIKADRKTRCLIWNGQAVPAAQIRRLLDSLD